MTTLTAGVDLTGDDTAWAMNEIMTGEANPVAVAGFLIALRAKGETVEELRALADGMLAHARRIEVPGPSIDIVGTGGDRSNTVNISTMSSVVMAAAGLKVVKHGNRAASSKSGSADVLEELGVVLGLSPEAVMAVAEEAGITFCFAQTFHPSMRHAAAARSGLGVGTAFNVLGPLTNPAQPTYAVIGAADARVAPLMAGVFAERGTSALVFRGDDGLDELTIADSSHLWWVSGGEIRESVLSPEDVGLQRNPIETLRGDDKVFNAAVARRVLAGERSPVRDAVLLNAGAALALAQAEGRAVDDPAAAVREGMARAAEVIDSGAASAALDRWVAVTRRLAAAES
ncbi:anthranilate phosphoribosyltransferase [Janibacter sp. G1551]|uniref:anthranilate phosphoribosyltransferase n=1 Tax=Janibacter sp. G1551 TaxID=3420440 RepID=UPI003D0556A5